MQEPVVAAWEKRGRYRTLGGWRIFTIDTGPVASVEEPVLVLHGFPTSSYDFHFVIDSLAAKRRVLALDMLGYGLSDKPDVAYTMALQADIVAAFVADAGVERLALLTHDMGDTVGGELLARQLEGTWPVEVTRRVLTNGSIYIELAQLSAGQLLLLSMPDRQIAIEAFDEASLAEALRATFSPAAQFEQAEVDAMADFVLVNEGPTLLPRLIRYIEERRRNQARFTDPIERHPSPLTIIWGEDDPIAVRAMALRLGEARPDATLELLSGVGHYPMVEAPERFIAFLDQAFAPAG